MMNNSSLHLAPESAAPGPDSRGIPIAAFSDITRLIERLHRRYLDVIRLELSKNGLDDINAVQAVLLTNVKDAEVSIRELVDRGYYIGSNVTYNVRHLVQCGYVVQSRSERDRRSVKIKLTERGLEVCKLLGEMEQRHADAMGDTGRQLDDVETARNTLRALERVWSDSIQY